MDNNHYNKKLKGLAIANRQSMTKSEACLWKYLLSRRQMMGYQFRRQRPIANYIVDFVCLPLKLIIEVDGITHDDSKAIKRDLERDLQLSILGFTTLRFSSWEVLNKMDDVSILISGWIKENAKCPPPGPRQRGKQKK